MAAGPWARLAAGCADPYSGAADPAHRGNGRRSSVRAACCANRRQRCTDLFRGAAPISCSRNGADEVRADFGVSARCAPRRHSALRVP